MHGLILLVEDEQKIRDLVRGYLEREGFRVLSTGSGAEALELWRHSHPDLLIVDLGLPDVAGESVVGEIRRQSDVPIIVLTAKAAEEDRIVGLELGVDDYVGKPFSPRELADGIDRDAKALVSRLESQGLASAARASPA